MIYLDNAATTRICEAAMERARELFTENYYNPSAKYGGGFAVSAMIKKARGSLLAQIADPSKFELIFTSGGTEGDNQAVFCGARRGNAVTTEGEHAAVYASFTELKNRGVEPRFVPVRRDGGVDAQAIAERVDEKTSFVSVIHVNNETGAINDVAAIARAVKAKNPRVIFHADGVQAFGKIPVRLTSDIDLYTVSAHKIGGAKGTGALVKRKGLTLPPLLFGGGQEGGLRSGTENPFGIVAFSAAAEEWFSRPSEDAARIAACREALFSALDKTLFRRISPEGGSPYILSVSAVGMRGEVLQRMLWDRGVVVGTGSACSSKHRFSRVILACGYPKDVADGVLRLSFSRDSTREEALQAARACNEAASEFSERV